MKGRAGLAPAHGDEVQSSGKPVCVAPLMLPSPTALMSRRARLQDSSSFSRAWSLPHLSLRGGGCCPQFTEQTDNQGEMAAHPKACWQCFRTQGALCPVSCVDLNLGFRSRRGEGSRRGWQAGKAVTHVGDSSWGGVSGCGGRKGVPSGRSSESCTPPMPWHLTSLAGKQP